MRVNINFKNFRKRDREGTIIREDDELEKTEPRRRKAARELRERERYLKLESSFFYLFKKMIKNLRYKLKNIDQIKYNLKQTPRSHYFLFFATVFLGIIGIALNINTYKELAKEKYSTYTLSSEEDTDKEKIDVSKYETNVSSISEKAEETKVVAANSNNVVASNTEKKQDSTKNITTIEKPVQVIKKEAYVFKYIKPIEGAKVLKIFSMDNVIYSKTLDMWKTHEGIDFSATIGTKVISIEKGVIEKVYTDTLYGVSIILNHGNGYKSIYRNLDEKVTAKEGQSVTKGQNIGIIGNTGNCENKDESHLHFELVKGTDIVNPSVIGIS